MDDSFDIRRLHPHVLRVIEEHRCPSPCSGPRDEEQPKSGSLIELRHRNEARRRTDSVLWKSREILAQKQLANEELTPAPVGWTKTLADPGKSNLLQRRGARSKTEAGPSHVAS